MRILFSAHVFPPSIGGIEEVSSLLAREFTRAGHEVIVITQTPERGDASFPHEVRRRPGEVEVARLTRWCDVVFHSNVSLRTAWPLLWFRKPWVVAHHTWIARADGRRSIVDRVKLRAIRTAENVAVSGAIAAGLGHRSRVIPNPYRDDVFQLTNRGPRAKDVIFVGRLVSDKGVNLLLEALALLKTRGSRLSATVVGVGPERAALELQARRLAVDVSFTGALVGEALARLLNEHRALVAPSLWEEPFGIVVLEGMACGCVPVVARAGGLPEAAGAAGVIFPRGEAAALAGCLDALLGDAPRMRELQGLAAAHLREHRAGVIAGRYLALLREALG